MKASPIPGRGLTGTVHLFEDAGALEAGRPLCGRRAVYRRARARDGPGCGACARRRRAAHRRPQRYIIGERRGMP